MPEVPFAIPSLAIVLRMRTDERDIGDHRLLLEFLNLDDVQTLPPEPTIVIVPDTIPDAPAGEEQYTQLVAQFVGLPILRSGLHRLRFIWDDKLIRELGLPVVVFGAEPPAIG